MTTSATGHQPDKTNGLKSVPIDEMLWHQCKAALANAEVPPKDEMPYQVGNVEKFGVYLVDGNQIEIDHDMDFVQGGNGWEDPGLCRKDQIFLDARHLITDLPFVLMHEVTESIAMRDKGWKYDRAHELANAVEKQLRMRETQ